ncbi:MAG: CRTAC1 family protein, partial [Bacteroidota bacterium]
QEAVAGSDAAGARMQAGFLRNMLLSTYSFRQDLLQVQTPTEEVGDLIDRFILMPSPTSQPAPADMLLAYSELPPNGSRQPVPQVSQAVSVDGEGPFDMLDYSEASANITNYNEAWRASKTQGFGDIMFKISSVSLLDFNYDFLIDLALVGDKGVKFVTQDSTGAFSPVLLDEGNDMFIEGVYTNSWVADIDLEGDLDLVLAGENDAEVLRNNGDGTFERRNIFPEVQELVDFAWGDFDGDGDPDAALLDAAGEVYLYANDRLGDYTQQIIPPIFGEAIALAVADTDADALMELVVLMRDGSVYSLANLPGEGWVVTPLLKWDAYEASETNSDGLFVHDFDNNGSVDVLLAGATSQVWLNNGPGTYEPAGSVPGIVQSVADLNADGLLDLTGINADGEPAKWQASGTMDYHWQVLRPRAGQALGDQRINSFTIGGEVEIRAGLLYQKQPILSPIVHMGLGTHEKTDVARLIWPNGDIQSEFDLAADQSIFTPQRLKGSCPWLFTYDGEKMRFVTDFIWRSPLGLRINAQETAGTVTTEDWVKIRGDELVPKDGYYDVRITAELWETHFFDHVSLLAVDHPEDTEIYIDERFGFPPPEMKVHHTSAIAPVEEVITDLGDDATSTVANRDGQYLDFFGRGMYQGITRMHHIEIGLPEAVTAAEEPVLVAFGWVRPTDSSINVAISQGGQDKPQGLILEVQQADGSWRMIRDDIGFPAGKTKTVLIDLAGVFDGDAQPRIRLSTNLEVYWDHIGWANRSDAELNITQVEQIDAELVYRGFSKVTAADASSPETPDYQVLEGTQARWRDLVGYYTRFGAVDTLLAQTDDRYVIMNAGDEMRFRFEALPDPPAGWTRDFVLVGDGWVKDGDYNTAFGKTVLPLPTHADPSYDRKPRTLFDDPVYQQHAADWQQFHTRYVAPDRFREALADR